MSFKSFLKALLPAAMMVLAMTQSSFAEITVNDDRKSLGEGYGVVTDDFEATEVTEEDGKWARDYPMHTNNVDLKYYYHSDVVQWQNEHMNNSNMYLVPGKGTDNSIALRVGVTAGSGHLRLLSRNINFFDSDNRLIDGMAAAMTYDLLIEENSTSAYENGKCFRIGVGKWFNADARTLFKILKDDDNNFYFETLGKNGGEDTLYYELNKWYTVQLVQTTSVIEGYIIDRETGEVLLSNSRNNAPQAGSGQYFNAIYLNPGTSNCNDGIKAYLDNLQVNIFNSNDDASLTSSSITDGDTEIARNTSVELGFDKNVDASQIVVRDKNGDELSEDSYDVKSIGMFRRSIAFTQLLGKNEEYTVDLSAVGAPDITFTTKSQYILDAEYIGKEVSEDKKTLTVSYKLNDSSALTNVDCRIMAIMYDEGKMTDAAMISLGEEDNVNTELEAEFHFTEEIGENTSISIVFFESGAYIPMSTGIACE